LSAHGDRGFGHCLPRLKPAFTSLLTPTRLVQGNNNIGLGSLKISGRIVERDMSIFADANERQIDRMVL